MYKTFNWLAIMVLVVPTAVAQNSPEASQQQTPNHLHDLASKGNALALLQLKALANNGDLEAAFQLFTLYFTGQGVLDDPAQAVTWARKAAEGGHAEAQANLGTAYSWGRGVAKDLALAVSWYRQAAEQGNIHGQLSLGGAYQNGSGVPKDLVSAYMWMDLAAQQGPKFTTPGVAGFQSYTAQTARDDMAKQMSPAQIAEAQGRSRDWKPKVKLVALACSSPAFCGEILDVARRGDFERVRVLLKGNPDLVSTKDKNGMTPLLLAAGAGHADVVKLLLASKADVNARGNNGLTPLFAAAALGHKDTVQLLLANQADVNAREDKGMTPLFVATFTGHADVVKLLLASKADVNAADNNGTTPLHVAAVKDVAEMLLTRQQG
jgi:Ankyrin repeats (3 copies)/Sel1 repeat/Ankyrin repeat